MHRLLGKKFGKLTVISKEGSEKHSGSSNAILWRVRCDCGNESVVRSTNLVQGRVKSCGCLRAEQISEHLKNGIFYGYKYSAEKRGLCWGLSRNDFDKLIIAVCHYCGKPPASRKQRLKHAFTYNGLDRKNNNEGYVPGNVVSSCFRCNKAKGTMPHDGFLELVAEIYYYQAEIKNTVPTI